MPWESRVGVAPVVQPPCCCRHVLSSHSSSSLPNPVVRCVVSSTPQTSTESERRARRDSYRQRRRPNAREGPDELSAPTDAIINLKEVEVGSVYEGILYNCFNDIRCE